MSEKPEPTAEASDLRALLTVVLDAITLPYSVADYDRRILDRTALARTVVSAVLAEAPADLVWNANYLRQKLAAEQADADERAKNQCGRCHRPFDPTDVRFDGRARYRETAYCRACVDNCHDGSAEHVCVICEPKLYGGGR